MSDYDLERRRSTKHKEILRFVLRDIDIPHPKPRLRRSNGYGLGEFGFYLWYRKQKRVVEVMMDVQLLDGPEPPASIAKRFVTMLQVEERRTRPKVGG